MIGVVISVLSGAALCVAAVLLLSGPFPSGLTAYRSLPFAHHSTGAGAAVPVTLRSVLVTAVALVLLLGFEVSAMFFLNGVFRRTVSGEAFFLVSYMLSLSLEVFRLVAALVAVRGLSPALAVAATRVVAMGRIYGLASLFFATLCSLGMRYSDYAVLSGIGLLLAVVMGSVVPVDASRLSTGLVYAISDGGGLLSVGATGAGIVALGSFLTPVVRRDRRLVGYGLAVTCLLVGRELVGLGGVVASASGLLLLVGGTYLGSRLLERMYLGIT